MINYAHRGASEYAPENTFAAFYLGLEMGANGIETDVQRTKDGYLVLFHDDALKRILPGVEGGVQDYTLSELEGHDFGAFKHEKYRGEKIVLLEEFLRFFGRKDLEFAIEIKQEGIEKAVLEQIGRFGVEQKCVITSFYWDSLLCTRALDENIRTGYLTSETGEGLFARMAQAGIWQYCPRADLVTPQLVGEAKRAGFSVRAWGVHDAQLMESCIASGVDGMTVNFPDVLAGYLSKGEGRRLPRE